MLKHSLPCCLLGWHSYRWSVTKTLSWSWAHTLYLFFVNRQTITGNQHPERQHHHQTFCALKMEPALSLMSPPQRENFLLLPLWEKKLHGQGSQQKQDNPPLLPDRSWQVQIHRAQPQRSWYVTQHRSKSPQWKSHRRIIVVRTLSWAENIPPHFFKRLIYHHTDWLIDDWLLTQNLVSAHQKIAVPSNWNACYLYAPTTTTATTTATTATTASTASGGGSSSNSSNSMTYHVQPSLSEQAGSVFVYHFNTGGLWGSGERELYVGQIPN